MCFLYLFSNLQFTSTYISGLLSHIGLSQNLTEILVQDGQWVYPDAPILYTKQELLGCYETVYCILYPTSDPWCTEINTRSTDKQSLQISKF